MPNKSISQLTAGGAVSSTDIFPDVQTAGIGPVKVTAAQIGNYVLSGSGLTGTLPVANGGTGLTSLTAGCIPYGNGTGAFGSSANLTYDGTNIFVSGNANSTARLAQIRNTNTGSSASTTVSVGNNTGISAIEFGVNSSANTGTYSGADGAFILSGYGGLTIQTQTSGKHIYLNPNAANVGINTGATAPARKLDIVGSGTEKLIRLSAQNPSITFAYGAITAEMARIEAVNVAGNGGALAFYTQTGSASANASLAMTLDASGNLGIGTSSPSSLLEISKSQNADTAFRITNVNGGASARANIIMATNSSNYQLAVSSTYIQHYTSNAIPHQWWTSGVQAMTLDASGNLLVGTTSLAYNTHRLTVSGGEQFLNKQTTINSSTATTIAKAGTGIFCIRDASNGGAAFVLFDFGTISIINQIGTVFVTTAPAANQIQLTQSLISSEYLIQALAGSSRNNAAVRVACITMQ